MPPRAKPKDTVLAAGTLTAKLDGSVLHPNDHVFVSAPWPLREGEPYAVARIIEFLPSLQPSLHAPSASTSTSTETRVRVGYFLRPRDISNRYIADFRLLVATMHSDVVPLSYLRGRCVVKHKDEVADMDAYKRRADGFYWNQLYDRYLHRYFDAVLVGKIQNAPANVVRHLVENFEYILCEAGMSSELCDAQRGCTVCFKWASNPESVVCAMCKHIFHLSCLDPPLTQKPRVGYSWACAPCSRAHDEGVETYMETGVAPPKQLQVANGKGKGKGKEKGLLVPALDKGKGRAPVKRAAGSMRTTGGWPFRYFGMHTEASAVLDPHDSLYPRASTRLGNKFQAIVPAWDEELGEQGIATDPSRSYFARKAGALKIKKNSKLPIVERGEDAALKTIIYAPSEAVLDSDLDNFLASIKNLPAYSEAGVDLINRALSLVKDGTTTLALAAVRRYKAKDMGHPVWTSDEQLKLVEGTERFGNDIEDIADEIKTKKIGEIVKRYYIVLGHAMQEDIPQQLEEKEAAASRVEKKGSARSRRIQHREDSESDDEGSECGQPVTAAARRGRACAICSEKESEQWYRCPDALGSVTKASVDIHVMCDDCSVRWRHYGIQYAAAPDEPRLLPALKTYRRVEKAAPVEVESESESESEEELVVEPIRVPTPPPPPPPPPPKPKPLPPKPCVLCKRLEPKISLTQCKHCTLSVHAACYGIVDDTDLVDWLCDLCDLQKNRQPLAAHPQCILCPSPKEIESATPTPLTALECLKPTEGHNYLHVLCAVWHPEIKFSEPAFLETAEGLAFIPTKRRTAHCSICNVSDVGACVKCEDCSKYFHVGCAWTSNYKFAFEIQPLKKKSASTAVKFKDEEGSMSPGIWCTDHHFSQAKRVTYDLGARDTRSKLTALQAYVRSFKGAGPLDTFPLLRQARRLDAQCTPALAPPPPPPPPPPPSPPPVVIPEPEVVFVMAPPPPLPPKRKLVVVSAPAAPNPIVQIAPKGPKPVVAKSPVVPEASTATVLNGSAPKASMSKVSTNKASIPALPKIRLPKPSLPQASTSKLSTAAKASTTLKGSTTKTTPRAGRLSTILNPVKSSKHATRLATTKAKPQKKVVRHPVPPRAAPPPSELGPAPLVPRMHPKASFASTSTATSTPTPEPVPYASDWSDDPYARTARYETVQSPPSSPPIATEYPYAYPMPYPQAANDRLAYDPSAYSTLPTNGYATNGHHQGPSSYQLYNNGNPSTSTSFPSLPLPTLPSVTDHLLKRALEVDAFENSYNAWTPSKRQKETPSPTPALVQQLPLPSPSIHHTNGSSKQSPRRPITPPGPTPSSSSSTSWMDTVRTNDTSNAYMLPTTEHAYAATFHGFPTGAGWSASPALDYLPNGGLGAIDPSLDAMVAVPNGSGSVPFPLDPALFS